MKKKFLIFILTYNAEKHIKSVLDRIPKQVLDNNQYKTEILILDDASKDETCSTVKSYIKKHPDLPIKLLSNPSNQGYGGNQKIGYTYAVKNGFGAVVMLHGDGQYPPEQIEEMADPILSKEVDVTLGSRMITKKGALKGGMPFYKFVGNIVLTKLQNFILGSKLSEFHTGFRAYNVDIFKEIPFNYNSNDFDFDTDILIQLIDNKLKIKEISIPTKYGDEVCNVNGIKYAAQITYSTLISRVQKYGIYYNPKFDYTFGTPEYDSKTNFDSTHTYAIESIEQNSTVIDFGCGSGHIAKALSEKGCEVYGIDKFIDKDFDKYFKKTYECDLSSSDFKMPRITKNVDYIILLDVIEHLSYPEEFLQKLRLSFSKHRPKIIVTTGNVAFILLRLSLLFGSFNYGKRGILDLDHKRLYTFKSLKRLLSQQGYKVKSISGIPVPIPFIIGNNFLSRILLKINMLFIKISKGMFSFQMAFEVEMLPKLEVLLKQAENSKGAINEESKQ